ncbi:metal ABC transporter solute-binding protein, Zn/Mn family [Leptothoe sp. PORK10 BA2]|uniref:metal ABC transporter solute-binding protein, Zn/Mn family n=1 Tax=Leptothoe sp. PORK10 BA2 TaxID=3110254 RepID=UPI002B1EAE3F|nr:zinc ABC transporter substrate-binding protein [Leptothoe sp. PORK10 BA2]MEA5464534.1 zinc ABC transporter substrate-binding protein [Leptothoe sp. PORK10 BA2]
MSRLSFQRQVQQLSIMALGAIVTLGGCTTAPTATSEAEPSEAAAPEASLQVVTTFLPMTQFTKAVAGDRAEVVQLLPTNVGPHDFQAKPSDIQAVTNADVLVKNGLEMEFFLDDMIENAENPDLVTIDSSEEIATFVSGGEAGHDDHAEEKAHDDHAEAGHDDHAEEKAHDDHAEAGHDDHAEEKAHDDHAEAGHDDHGEAAAHADEHAHGEFDPHVWLDPKRAIEQVENIRDGLIAADPEGEAEYTANAAEFITELQTLDADITKMLSPFAGQTFVVFHDFAAYFASSYGLEADVLVGLPEENPSPDDVKRVMDTVQAEGLKTIMTEPQAGESSFKAIAQDLSIGVSEFDPLEVGPPEAIEPDYYLATMRQNAENLANGFGASTQSWYPFSAPPLVAVINWWL